MWLGAGFGAAAGRPDWHAVLTFALEQCRESEQSELRALLDRGRYGPVLAYVNRQLGETAVRESMAAHASDEAVPAPLVSLSRLPWRACLVTSAEDLVARSFGNAGRPLPVVMPEQARTLSLRTHEGFFVASTPPRRAVLRPGGALFDLVEEIVHSRTLVLLGFAANDPDLALILELLAGIGAGGEHVAIVPGATVAEREDWRERSGVQVLAPPQGTSLEAIVDAIVDACADVEPEPRDREAAIVVLDLVRAVQGVPLRADLAEDVAATIDGDRIARWLERLEEWSQPVPASTLLAAGGVLLAHGDVGEARHCFERVAGAGGEHALLGAFDLALATLAAGEPAVALEGLRAAADSEPELAIVPPTFEPRELSGRVGNRWFVTCKERGAPVDVVAVTSPRPLASDERRAFEADVERATAIDHPAVARVRAGVVEGRVLAVVHEHAAGVVLAHAIARGEAWPLARMSDIAVPLLRGLETCHGRGLVHGNIDPTSIVLAAEGPRLRGFGFASLGVRAQPWTGDRLGTVAPEGAGLPPADVYAVAALLYRLLTGRPPQGSVPPLEARIDARVEPLLRTALHPDPVARPGAGVLAAALEAIVRAPEQAPKLREAGSPPPPPSRRTSPRVRDDRLQVESVAAVAPSPSPSVKNGSALSVKITAPEDPDDLDAWAWILERKPTHIEARQHLERIEREARQSGRWDRVVEVLAVKAEHAQVQRTRARHLGEMVELFERELAAPANAFAALQQLLEVVEPREQPILIDKLMQLAELTGKWSDVLASLGTLLERNREPVSRAAVLVRIGHVLADRLDEGERALATYQQAFTLAPSTEALLAMLPLRRNAGQFAELASALLSLADLQSGAARHEALVEAARVLREPLEDLEGALGTVEILLEEAPEHREGLDEAVILTRALARWDELPPLLARRADLERDPAAARALRLEAAEVLLVQCRDSDAAIAQLTRVVRADRTDKATAQRLAALLREPSQSEPSRRAALVDVLAELVKLTQAPEEKAELLAEMAELLDARPDGRQRAIDVREAILGLVPPDHVLARSAARVLEAGYRERDDANALEDMLKIQAERDGAAPELRAEAWAKLLALRKQAGHERGIREALEALARLAPHEGKWRDELVEHLLARDDLTRVGKLLEGELSRVIDPERRARLSSQRGDLLVRQRRLAEAVAPLEEAVRLDATHVPAWQLLRTVYRELGEPLKSTQALVSAAEHEPDPATRAGMLLEAAKAYTYEHGFSARAQPLLEQVVALTPDDADANLMLLDRLVEIGELARAWPYARRHAEHVLAHERDEAALVRALVRAGRSALAARKVEAVRALFERAGHHGDRVLELVILRADLDVSVDAFRDALRHYQRATRLGLDGLATGERSRIHLQMARAHAAEGENAAAVQMAERALDLDPGNDAAGRLLVELGLAVDHAAALRAKERLVATLARKEDATDDVAELAELQEQRADLLSEIASLQMGPLSAHRDGVRTLERLLELRPDDTRALHRLLDAYTTDKRWREATNVLSRLADADTDPGARAKYLYTGALVLRENLNQSKPASEWLKRVLELDPGHEHAFEAQLDLLTEREAWPEVSKLIRNYLKAQSMAVPPARSVLLFEQLAQSHRNIGDEKTALAALDQAQRIAEQLDEKPEVRFARRSEVMRIAIHIGQDELDKAIHHGHAIIAERPMEFEVYHRLVEIYLARGERDRARAVARTLKFLRQADEAEEELAGTPRAVRGTITREQWQRAVYHPAEDTRIADVFTFVWPMVAAREGRTPSHHGLERGARVEINAQSPTAVARYVAYACQVLDAPLPHLFARPKVAGDIVVDALADDNGSGRVMVPAVIAGRDAMNDHSEPGLKFRAARAVARARPEHLLASVLPTPANLRHVLWGALRITHPRRPVPPDAHLAAEDYAKHILNALPPARSEQLRTLTDKLVEAGEMDTRKWLQGVAYTCNRAGFVLSDSIETSAQIISREAEDGSGLSAKERVADLIAFSVSENYLDLRQELGLSR